MLDPVFPQTQIADFPADVLLVVFGVVTQRLSAGLPWPSLTVTWPSLWTAGTSKRSAGGERLAWR